MAEISKENENSNFKDDMPKWSSPKQPSKVRLPLLHEVIPNSHITPVDPLRKMSRKIKSPSASNVSQNRSNPYAQKNNISPIYSSPLQPLTQQQQHQRQIPSIKSLVQMHNNLKMNRIDVNTPNHPAFSSTNSNSTQQPVSKGFVPSNQHRQPHQQVPHQNYYHQTQHLPFHPKNTLMSQTYYEQSQENYHFQKQNTLGMPSSVATHLVGFQTVSNNNNVPLPVPQLFNYPVNNTADSNSDRQIMENPNRYPIFLEQTFPAKKVITELNYHDYRHREVRIPTLIHEHIVPLNQNNGPKKIKVLKRTRTGCLTCRKRRIKCDERKPYCLKCERSKKNCLGYMNLDKPDKLPKKKKKTTNSE